MDIDKFVQKLFSREDLKNVPVIYLCQVAIAILEIINEGDVFYSREEL